MLADEAKITLGESEKSFALNPKNFKTGSRGYHAYGKLDGTEGKRYQVNIILTEIGSKGKTE